MQVIKKVLIIFYTLFLGFILFFNTSIYGADLELNQGRVFNTTSDIDNYFINLQDFFDYQLISKIDNSASQQFINFYNQYKNGYYIYIDTKYTPQYTERGFTIYFIAFGSDTNVLSNNSSFVTGNIRDYYENIDTDLYFTALKPTASYKVDLMNGFTSISINTNYYTQVAVPLSVVMYPHNILNDYLEESSTSGGTAKITNAIQQQTNTIKEESQKQQNAVATATQKQTNELLDTNNTGNETMSVNDTTTDTSADLSSIYNNISSAFTSYDPTISWGKDFVFTLPNGDNFTINLDSSLILNFLDNYPVLKAFYQSIFWVIFGGYVIFDFKKIINKMKEGNIDNVVGTSSPVDSVVNMSLK